MYPTNKNGRKQDFLHQMKTLVIDLALTTLFDLQQTYRQTDRQTEKYVFEQVVQKKAQ
jgi:hypothetical protein